MFYIKSSFGLFIDVVQTKSHRRLFTHHHFAMSLQRVSGGVLPLLSFERILVYNFFLFVRVTNDLDHPHARTKADQCAAALYKGRFDLPTFTKSLFKPFLTQTDEPLNVCFNDSLGSTSSSLQVRKATLTTFSIRTLASLNLSSSHECGPLLRIFLPTTKLEFCVTSRTVDMYASAALRSHIPSKSPTQRGKIFGPVVQKQELVFSPTNLLGIDSAR
mmetsp:Transcript_27905/g.52078  ORF Transcript_27905/g.52078 Transcript_27905/m.52078 type:complete len:217 (-) Transcript_27905:776-1426(-)